MPNKLHPALVAVFLVLAFVAVKWLGDSGEPATATHDATASDHTRAGAVSPTAPTAPPPAAATPTPSPPPASTREASPRGSNTPSPTAAPPSARPSAGPPSAADRPAQPSTGPPSRSGSTPSPGAAGRSGLPQITRGRLPPEARETLADIASGGPYDFSKDDTVFHNRERLLPRRKRGYYREYTVVTPGLRHRGARRIVAGSSGELFYTDDHYATFEEIVP
ncbi:MAG: hypothetical protein K0V04_13480 [Deltaproteobacteria bacterium]|nr:hypothetical protein [Deltaproteobacteria bacterium]